MALWGLRCGDFELCSSGFGGQGGRGNECVKESMGNDRWMGKEKLFKGRTLVVAEWKWVPELKF